MSLDQNSVYASPCHDHIQSGFVVSSIDESSRLVCSALHNIAAWTDARSRVAAIGADLFALI